MNVQTFVKAATLFVALGLMTVSLPADAQRNRRNAEAEKKEVLYPNASRQDPKISPVGRLQRDMQKLIEAYDEQKYDLVIERGEKLAGNKAAGAYERAMAWQLIGIARSEQDDGAGAIDAFQKAIDANGLDNNGHYQIMLQLAQAQAGEERLPEAIATLDRMLSESGSEDPQLFAMRASFAYESENYADTATYMKRAIAASPDPQDSWSQMLMAAYIEQQNFDEASKLGEELLAKKPDDARLLYNVATLYAQMERDEQATALLERGRSKGILDERGYRQLYALYLNMDGKEKQAITAVEDGLNKGVLQPNAEVYTVLGQAYYFSEQMPQAIDAYRKAIPHAKDGEAALNLARLLSNEEQYAEAKQLAQEAISKGLRRPGDAWMVIARAEFGLGNRAAMVSAYREAAKFPETQQQAEDWLKKNASR